MNLCSVRNISGKAKSIAWRNLDSLLEHDGFDQAAYSQKRNGFLLEIKAMDQKLKNTQKDLDELRQRKTEEAEFTELMSGADPFRYLRLVFFGHFSRPRAFFRYSEVLWGRTRPYIG
jgi:hypothetical protein